MQIHDYQQMVKIMTEIRNIENKLVAMFEEKTHTIIIVRRDCETRLVFQRDGTMEVKNSKHESK